MSTESVFPLDAMKKVPDTFFSATLKRFLTPFLCLLWVAGCDSSASHPVAVHAERTFAGETPIRVLCTTGQVAEMLTRIGGAHVEVTTLMAHDIDPHQFKPRFEHLEQLEQADAIFYSGLHLEGRMADLFVQRARTQPTYAVTEGVVSRHDQRLREPPEFEGMFDPHVWHDVALWSDCAGDVAVILAQLDPTHAQDYAASAQQYRAELAELDQFCRETIAQIPPAARVMVTAHDAFGYFGQAYGLEVFGLKGISTEEEKDLAHQDTIQQMLIERKIPAVFVEHTLAHRTIEALIEPCRAAGWDLQNGGELYADSLGPAGSDAATYAGMIRHNVNTILHALAPGTRPAATRPAAALPAESLPVGSE
jgi:manganese/zinc/iron transport system substrate-binding protein